MNAPPLHPPTPGASGELPEPVLPPRLPGRRRGQAGARPGIDIPVTALRESVPKETLRRTHAEARMDEPVAKQTVKRARVQRKADPGALDLHTSHIVTGKRSIRPTGRLLGIL